MHRPWRAAAALLSVLVGCEPPALVETGADSAVPPLGEPGLGYTEAPGSLPSAGGEEDPPPAEEGVRLFVRAPLAGNPPTTNWFNHAPEDDAHAGELVYTGEWQDGDPKHFGYDFITPIGTPVFAPADGVVTMTTDGVDFCPQLDPPERPSQMVRLLHPGASNGKLYSTLYMHLDEVVVAEGDEVRAGDTIALSGNTGCSTGPHLHFGVSEIADPETMAGVPVDPFGWEGDFPDPWRSENVNLWVDPPALRRAAASAE